ncbi:MAG: methyl-accepting chemotaxis protein [Candidatus Hodarchaeota archaeon]
MKEKKQQNFGSILERIFDNPNFLRAAPLLLLPTVIAGLLSVLLVNILPESLMETKTPEGRVLVLIPVISVLIIISLKIIYKNSLSFRISFNIMLIVATVAGIVAYTNLYEGTIGSLFILLPGAVVFVVIMITYTIRSIQRPLNIIIDETNKVAVGNLTFKQKGLTDHGSEFGEYEQSFSSMVKNMSGIILQAQEAAEHVTSSVQELVSTSEEVNALSEEIAATIQQINRGASNQAELAENSFIDINKMSEIVDLTLRDIENTLQVIEDIADQTNILALNAAIEAARAGEYGRGFAVVSDNVRRLAEETKSNASDISKLTEKIVTNIGGSVIKIQESLQGFTAQSEEFSASSEEVAAATEEQSAGMHQLTTAAQDLAIMSEKLSKQVSLFKIT